MFEDLFFKSSNQAATAGTYSQASFFAFPFISPSSLLCTPVLCLDLHFSFNLIQIFNMFDKMPQPNFTPFSVYF
jgi:hypothetical protein